MTDRGTVLVVSVHFHDPGAIERLLTSLCNQATAGEWVFLVVDNGSSPSERTRIEQLAQHESRMRFLSPPGNLGYFGGLEFGRRYAAASGLGACRWFVATNQDVELDTAFLHHLSNIQPCIENVVLAPAITSAPGGAALNPFMISRPRAIRTTVRALAFCTLTGIRLAVVIAKGRQMRTDPPPLSPGSAIYAPHGSLIVFAREYFEASGSLQWSAFMYGEEIFVAEQVRDIHGAVRFWPSLRATHHEHSTTGVPSDKVVLRHKRQGTLRAAHLLLHRPIGPGQ